jgi:serine/threonine protein kinase
MEQRVGKDYKMLRRLGNGAFGEIYEGQNINTREIVAIKLEPLSTQFPQLEYEHNLYKIMRGKGKFCKS